MIKPMRFALAAFMAAFLLLAPGHAQDVRGTSIGLGSGLTASSAYNPGTQKATTGSVINQQLVYLGVATSCVVDSTCSSATNKGGDSGHLITFTAAGQTGTIPASGPAGSATYSFGYDGTDSYSVASSSTIHSCGTAGTTISGIATQETFVPEGSQWQCVPSGGGSPGSGSSQAIASISLSNSSYTPDTANGTVGTVSVVMSPSSPSFSGTLSITGINGGGFQLSGTTLEENSGGTTGAGPYSDFNIVATQSSASNSPQFISPTVTGGPAVAQQTSIAYASGGCSGSGCPTTIPSTTAGHALAVEIVNFSNTTGQAWSVTDTQGDTCTDRADSGNQISNGNVWIAWFICPSIAAGSTTVTIINTNNDAAAGVVMELKNVATSGTIYEGASGGTTGSGSISFALGSTTTSANDIILLGGYGASGSVYTSPTSPWAENAGSVGFYQLGSGTGTYSGTLTMTGATQITYSEIAVRP